MALNGLKHRSTGSHHLSKHWRGRSNVNFFRAMNQLERLQRLRKGDNVPAPLNLQVLSEPPTLSEQQDSHS